MVIQTVVVLEVRYFSWFLFFVVSYGQIDLSVVFINHSLFPNSEFPNIVLKRWRAIEPRMFIGFTFVKSHNPSRVTFPCQVPEFGEWEVRIRCLDKHELFCMMFLLSTKLAEGSMLMFSIIDLRRWFVEPFCRFWTLVVFIFFSSVWCTCIASNVFVKLKPN